MKGWLSPETVVPHQWASEIQKFGIIPFEKGQITNVERLRQYNISIIFLPLCQKKKGLLSQKSDHFVLE